MAVNKNIAQGNALGFVLNIIIAEMDNFSVLLKVLIYFCIFVDEMDKNDTVDDNNQLFYSFAISCRANVRIL